MKKLILTAVLSAITHTAHGSMVETGADETRYIPQAKQLRDTGYTEYSDEEEQSSEIVARGDATVSRKLTIIERIVPSLRRRAKAEIRANEILDHVGCPAVLRSLMMGIMLYEDPAYQCIEPLASVKSGWTRWGLEGVSAKAVHVLELRSRLGGRKTTTAIIVNRTRVFMQSTGWEDPSVILEQQDAEDAINDIDISSVWKLTLLAVNPTTYDLPDEPSGHSEANARQFVTKAEVREHGPLVAASNCRAEWYRYTWPWTPAIIWQYDPYLYVPA
ncbi:MAG: hypothetical protein LBR78_01970 [Holosporales bacterium]|jgi:hypothetical protein|nr:hypothetical protein [Holosporales bacterium]